MSNFSEHRKGCGYANLQKELLKITGFTCSEFEIGITGISSLPMFRSVIELCIEINEGVYKGDVFRPRMYVGKSYPFVQPLVYNDQFFPHPNINQLTKQLAISFLVDWNPTYFLSDVIYHLAATLAKPDLKTIPNNTLNMEICSDYINREKRTRFFDMLQNHRMRCKEISMDIQETRMDVQEDIQIDYQLGETKYINFGFTGTRKSTSHDYFGIEKLILQLDFVKIGERRLCEKQERT